MLYSSLNSPDKTLQTPVTNCFLFSFLYREQQKEIEAAIKERNKKRKQRNNRFTGDERGDSSGDNSASYGCFLVDSQGRRVVNLINI